MSEAGTVTITETAATKIADMMLEDERPDAGLRVFVQGGGCSGFQYGLQIEDGSGDPETDKVFEAHGVRLYVDPISIRYLSGAQVDYVNCQKPKRQVHLWMRLLIRRLTYPNHNKIRDSMV